MQMLEEVLGVTASTTTNHTVGLLIQPKVASAQRMKHLQLDAATLTTENLEQVKTILPWEQSFAGARPLLAPLCAARRVGLIWRPCFGRQAKPVLQRTIVHTTLVHGIVPRSKDVAGYPNMVPAKLAKTLKPGKCSAENVTMLIET